MLINIEINEQDINQRKALLNDWQNFSNNRPPVIVFMDSPFYCKLAKIPIDEIYESPKKMALAQILGWKRLLETVDCDNCMPMVVIDFGSCFTGSIYGCKLLNQPASVPATEAWFESEKDIASLSDIEPFDTDFQKKALKYYDEMKSFSSDYGVQFGDSEPIYPLDDISLMTASEGPFTILCMIAGLDRVAMWCYEKPELVLKMMEIVTDKEIGRIKKTFEYMNKPLGRIFLADDYSPYMSLDIYFKFILPFQKKLCSAFTIEPYFHSCIPDKRLLKYWVDDLNINLFNGFKPQNGLMNFKKDYLPVAKLMSGKVLLEPDLDGANVMISNESELGKAVEYFKVVFKNCAGIKLCYTISGGHSVDDLRKCNVIKNKVVQMYSN